MGWTLLVAAFGTRGDVFPLLETALELARRGHSIRFLTHAAHKAQLDNKAPDGCAFEALFTDSVPLAHADDAATFSSLLHEDLVVDLATAEDMHFDGVIVNLFALELWHLVEKLGLPFVIVSPSRPPNHRPPNALAILKTVAPELFHLLCRDAHDQPHKLSMVDFEEWLWVAFHERWGSLRQRVALVPIPLTWCCNASDLPRAPLVIYGMSPFVSTLPGELPDRYALTGILQRPQGIAFHRQRCETLLPGAVLSFVDHWSKLDTRIVCVDLGAMWWYAVQDVTRIRAFLRILQEVFEHLGVVGLVLFHEHTQVQAENPALNNRLLCWPDAPHIALFGMIHAILHHGGAGTAHTALQLGLPQVLVPHMYDQYDWAQRLAELKLAPLNLCEEVLFDSSTSVSRSTAKQLLVSALEFALSPQTRLRCGSLGRRLRTEEDGLLRAGDLIEHYLETSDDGARHAAPLDKSSTAATHLDAPGLQWQEFENGLQLAFPYSWSGRPLDAEQLFRCSEFVSEHLPFLEPGDVIVDVGAAMVGCFPICCELQFNQPNALRILCVSTAAEPGHFEALQVNLQRFNSAAICVDGRQGLVADDIVEVCRREWPDKHKIRVLKVGIEHKAQEWLQNLTQLISVDHIVVQREGSLEHHIMAPMPKLESV